MRALITGATSGIGLEMAVYLARRGWKLILTGRNEEKLNELALRFGSSCDTICLDLSLPGAGAELYRRCSDKRVDMLVNNAGFGVFGEFHKSDFDTEAKMLAVNVVALHDITKLFLSDFIARDSGIILNVASSAAFLPGPLMAGYYSSKAYVYRLSQSIRGELLHRSSKVSISVLCPGPVATNFNANAGVSFSITPASSRYVARYAIDNALKRRFLIIPTLYMKLGIWGAKYAPDSLLLRIVYLIQRKKLS